MADNQVTIMIGAFIAVAIMLSVGVVILGNSTNNCTTLPGYNATTPGVNETITTAHTGWALTCVNNSTTTINAYGLLGVVLIVIAAVVILAVIKYL